MLSDHAQQQNVCRGFENTHIILNNSLLKRPLQKTLLNCASSTSIKGFLGLEIHTIKGLAEKQTLALEQLTPINESERLFMLSNTLKHYPKLLRSASPLQLAEDLHHLFDQLYFESVTLPSNVADMKAFLYDAYQTHAKRFKHLEFEADVVITLWQAWQKELQERQCVDEKQLFSLQLSKQLESVEANQHWYFLHLSDHFSSIEQKWLSRLNEKSQLTIIAPKKIKHDRSLFFQQALYPEKQDNAISHTVENLQSQTIACNSFEDEAQQAFLQLRYFYSLKKKNETIALLCEDRSLVRRLRAMLEQYDITLVDPFGWSLITTRAATLIQSIIDCAEQDFHYAALLEFLKSPFSISLIELESVYRLEHDIIRYENIHSNMNHYLRALDNRGKRLGDWADDDYQKVRSSLEHIQNCVQPLTKLFKQKNVQADEISETLLSTLNALELTQHLEDDAAGKVLIKTLESMKKISLRHSFKTSSSEYKGWLLHELNNSYLVNSEKHDDVTLINVKQSQGFSCNYLVIAGANHKKLPNLKKSLQFFNQRVLFELGLPTHKYLLNLHKTWFFELLARSKNIVITWQSEKNDEPQLSSHWITAINNLSIKNFGKPLPNARNSISIDKPSLNFKPSNHAESIRHYQDLIPKSLSVSAHQTLIDCPYEFFVSRLLGLKGTDEIKEQLEKNDYGSLVHQAIQAFHTDLEFLPGPFEKALNNENRDDAITLLSLISKKLFNRAIQNNYQDYGWLQKWLSFIPTYIDWEITEYSSWRHKTSEEQLSTDINNNTSLVGKIDRIDYATNERSSLRLIDYKTGHIPSKQSIESGENVQLSSYSLFLENINEVRYLGIDQQGKINQHRHIESDDLQDIKEQTLNRLEDLVQALHQNTPIPIWADNEKCQHCHMAGICRNGIWPK